jgi:hypothetical protein
LKSEAGDPDFGAALEAAAAAEGRPAEHAPKNEITIITKTDGPAAASKTEKKKKEKSPKAGNGEKLGHTIGGRVGIGTDIELGLGFNIGLTDVNRFDFGINTGLGIVNKKDIDGSAFIEMYVLYEWRFNISEELSWFAGAGGVIGYHKASWEETVRDTLGNPVKDKNGHDITEPGEGTPFGIGVGGRVGMEVDLSFIDPDHALSSLRSSLVSLDVRPMLCMIAKNYPGFRITVGINYSYVLGRGKSKEANDKEKK